jgi:predicted short-subunit dehydrogenase-like oxidoreductase (DUF2520 family)
MKISLIGAGNLATNIGVALFNSGNKIVQVYSHTLSHAMSLADRIEACATDDIDNVSDAADIYIVALKDAALEKIIPSLCKNKSDKYFFHTAGSMPMDVFKGYAQHYGVLYPMQTFSKQRIVDFSVIPCFIEGSDANAICKLKEVCSAVSNRIYELSSEQRKYLHLSAVFACNFANHCYEISSEILNGNGIPFDVMLPLIDETARKVHEMNPKDAQTGPAIRYDENVINRQMQLLNESPLNREIYEIMSKAIHATAENKNTDL